MNKKMYALIAFFAGCMNIPMIIINFYADSLGGMCISIGFMLISWGIAGLISNKK